MTSAHHSTGTDRLAEVAATCAEGIIVNVQGDEPMLDPRWVDETLEPMLADPTLEMATLSLPLRDPEEMLSPSVVKVVAGTNGDALYFSRSPIPWFRMDPPGTPREAALKAIEAGLARKHVGLYAYRRDVLKRFATLLPSPLEKAEGLEQLRALQNGIRIRVVQTDGLAGVAVDTPEDLERVRALLAADAPPPR